MSIGPPRALVDGLSLRVYNAAPGLGANPLTDQERILMSEPAVLLINTDGAARGNPGPAAFAYVISRDGTPIAQEKGCLGTMTNNQAEYIAMIRALEHAERLGTGHRLVVRSDSELMVKQMRGEYSVKNADLRELYGQAQRLKRRFNSVTFTHVPRAENGDADRLCNEALDGEARSPKSGSPAKSKKPAVLPTERTEAVRTEAVACLRSAAQAWARGNPENPPAEAVWEQLWSVLEEQGVLRKTRPS